VANRFLRSISYSSTLATLALAALCPWAQAQVDPAAENHSSPEIALQYTYVRSNAPPGDCDCFSLNGGSASIAKPFGSGHLAAVFDATVVHGTYTTKGSPAESYELTLTAITAGARYRPLPRSKWSPFGQILIGVANASGSLVEGDTPAAKDSTLNFASQVGGGVDYRLSRRFSVRIAEADYFLTTSSNGVNDHQNNLRLSTGIAYRFGRQ
jgi:outer membrane immunogenic protein